MELSEAGAQFLAKEEGLRLKRYNDPAGHCTVGIGHLLHLGRCDGRPGEFDLPNEAAAYELKRKDAARFTRVLNQIIRVPITQTQFDMLLSLAFNIGEEGIRNSTVIRRLNAGDYQGAADAFLMWAHGNPGDNMLLARRKRERSRFLSRTTTLVEEDTWTVLDVVLYC